MGFLRISKINNRLAIRLRVPDVEPPARDYNARESLLSAELIQAGSKLELSPFTVVVFNILFKKAENIRGQYILSENRQECILGQAFDLQVLPRVIQLGFFRKFGDCQNTPSLLPDSGGTSELGNLIPGSFFKADNAVARPFKLGEQLFGAGRVRVRSVDVIAQHEQEWLTTRPLPGAVDRVAESVLQILRDKSNPVSDIQQTLHILLVLFGELVKIFNTRRAAEKLFKEALQIQTELDNKEAMASILYQLGNVLGELGKYKRARGILEKTLAIQRELDDKEGLAWTLYNLGNITYQEWKFKKSR